MPDDNGNLTEAEKSTLRQRLLEALRPIMTGIMTREYAFLVGAYLINLGLSTTTACGIPSTQILQWIAEAENADHRIAN